MNRSASSSRLLENIVPRESSGLTITPETVRCSSSSHPVVAVPTWGDLKLQPASPLSNGYHTSITPTMGAASLACIFTRGQRVIP